MEKQSYEERITRAVALKCACIYMSGTAKPLTYTKEDSDYAITLAEKFAGWLSTGEWIA